MVVDLGVSTLRCLGFGTAERVDPGGCWKKLQRSYSKITTCGTLCRRVIGIGEINKRDTNQTQPIERRAARATLCMGWKEKDLGAPRLHQLFLERVTALTTSTGEALRWRPKFETEKKAIQVRDSSTTCWPSKAKSILGYGFCFWSTGSWRTISWTHSCRFPCRTMVIWMDPWT